MATKQRRVLIAGEATPTVKNPQGIRPFSLQEIMNMPMPEFMQKEGRIVNARNQTYYDTLRLEAGQPWNTGQTAYLFTKGRRGETKITNSNTPYTKGDADTNMIGDGEFEGGVTAIVYAIEVDFFLPARIPTSDVLGLITDAAPLAKSAGTYSATTLFFALTRQTKLTFWRGENPQENGLIHEFPSRNYATASFGGDNEEGFIQNARPGGSNLEFPKVLESNDPFEVRLEALATSLQLPIDVQMRVNLLTKRIGVMYV